MIKVEVIEPFTLARFNEISNIQRKVPDVDGKLNNGDIFECDKDMADYLMGNNDKNKVVVKIIEVIPSKLKSEAKPVEEKVVEEVKPKPKKRASKK